MNKTLLVIYDSIKENWRRKEMYGIVAFFVFLILFNLSVVFNVLKWDWEGKDLSEKLYFLSGAYFLIGIMCKTLFVFLLSVFFSDREMIEKKRVFFLYKLRTKKIIISRILGLFLLSFIFLIFWDFIFLIVNNFLTKLPLRYFIIMSVLTTLLSFYIISMPFAFSKRFSIMSNIFIGFLFLIINFYWIFNIFFIKSKFLLNFYETISYILPSTFKLIEFYIMKILNYLPKDGLKVSGLDIYFEVLKTFIFFSFFLYIALKDD